MTSYLVPDRFDIELLRPVNVFKRRNEMDSNPILLIDFDGVIHSYTSGWQGAAVINDAPVPGAFKFLWKAIEEFDVQIYSSRSREEGGVTQMKAWFAHNGVASMLQYLSFPTEKPAAFLTIDDRCIQFNGTWPKVEELLKFKPWNKK